jgi:NB-ARC domain
VVWAEALHLISPGQVPQLETITAQLNAVLRDKRMLLIIDDLWHVEHAAPFKVGGHACALVMTSRLNDVAQALAPTSYDLYRLPVLADESALELLGILSPETVVSYPDEARALVGDLEGLPLAIQVAGRLLQNEARLGWGVSELLAELREGAGLLTAQAPGDMIGAGRDTTPTITALLKRSTDSLDPEMRERFAYLGLFAPKPATFDLQAMAVAWDLNDPRPTVRVLVNRGLLEPVSGGRFQLHALLALHARSLLEE